MSTSVLTFVVVGPQDNPIYEVDLMGPKDQQAQYLHQFVLHAALDAVDEAMWSSKELHLKTVDRFNALSVTAFVTPGSARFLLLHDGRSDDGIRTFFTEVYEAYLRVFLNPLRAPTARITSREFDRKVKTVSKRVFSL
mmetsp:Transcript_6657/g.11333  ORF Transcript_6657/g.11333 Transcript_6657/m.11333 type:complete len:138 (-) Transcript_6657:313-726(-)|eukprot:CAMPEP_0119106980 /NCGR_PEP_ID=MMETSP1180-20130426/7882_1 /TAXON_ID=3052 ORGANISM="Chlamydomonas cf sp, Strain CCMP681" /NCGR_SAMPLE_ID=MMETSP1180 /ASSEMBLY_ACC=CAM_ASM_000741 /LENGTH=137 /DNA_ID=CAMNT_0007092401 /DNA_START=87 /DNA_END=500 /DNA_ORIENTATION=-